MGRELAGTQIGEFPFRRGLVGGREVAAACRNFLWKLRAGLRLATQNHKNEKAKLLPLSHIPPPRPVSDFVNFQNGLRLCQFPERGRKQRSSMEEASAA